MAQDHSSAGSGWLAQRYLHLATGLLFLVLAGSYLWFTFDIRVPPLGDPLGPRLFPLVLGTLFLLLALTFVARVVLTGKEEDDSRDMPAQRRAWTVFALLVVYVLVLPTAGFPLASGVFSFAALTLIGYRSLLVNLLAAVLLSAGFYLMFDLWLGVPLPALRL